MITPKKSKTKRVLLIATWAIAAYYNHSETAPLSLPIPFCSAWTMTPDFRHRHRHRHNSRYPDNNSPQQQRLQHRHESPLFSATASVPTKSEAEAANASETTTTYRDLFPPSDTITNGTLQLPTGDDDEHSDSDNSNTFHHTLYYEIHGTGPLTALFLHGGPGAGCFPNHARFFDPSKYTVVLLDQRGAGKSTPRGSVVDNTLDHLVEDCERVRRHLEPHFQKINNNTNNNCSETATTLTTTNRPWDVVLGGSWGATLGLAYSLKHPSAMKALVLRGVCALRPSEVDWLFGANGGSSQKMREAWKNFSHAVDAASDEEDDEDESSISSNSSSSSNLDMDIDVDGGGRDTLHAYYDCMFNVAGANGTMADNALRLAATRSWMMWEMAVTSSAVQNTGNTIGNSSSSSNNSSNNNDNNNGLVLVSSPESNGGNWRFENHLGEPMADDTGLTPEIMVSQLRMDIEPNSNSNSNSDIDIDGELPLQPISISAPRPVNPVGESMPLMASIREASKESNNNNNTGRFRLPPDYVPAQAMLTCYYSVNDRFVMGNNNLLESSVVNNNDNNNSHENEGDNVVKIIGIQGGRDPICPPDTALDLLRSLQASTNNMELRIPMESGHSMYDPAIKHELVTATDRLADEFLNESINE